MSATGPANSRPRVRMNWYYIWTLVVRAIRLRCPRCGAGKLYRRGYQMYEECQVCGWRFEREEGYWTGAMAINLIIAEMISVVILLPVSLYLAYIYHSIWPLILFSPFPVITPFLFYWHSKSLWMALDFIMNPVPLR